jgi:hypothetical protein
LGKVFRVQQILHDLPLTVLTNLLVIVATPEIKLKKLRATLSLFRISLGFPTIVATTFPLFIFLPSFVLVIKLIFLLKYLKASFAKFKPPIIPF